MSMRIILLVALVLTVGGLATAQLSAEAAPNPAPQGGAISLRVEAPISATLQLAGPIEVRRGSPVGAVVWTVGPCTPQSVTVGPGQPYWAMSWNGKNNGGNYVTPGTYFIRIGWRPTGSPIPWLSHWVPVRIDPTSGPTEPVLTGSTAPRGPALLMQLSAPNNPLDPNVAAASFTTNVGFILATKQLALDVDALFVLTIQQTPGLTYGFQGLVSPAGTVSLSLNVPNLAVLQGVNVAVQAVVVDKQAVWHVSNPITRVIL